MEFIALIISLSVNGYLVWKSQTKQDVSVYLPEPVVNVTVEAPEAVELTPVLECTPFQFNYDKFAEAIAKAVQSVQPVYPAPVPAPVPTYINPYPNYPVISEVSEVKETSPNVTEINGIVVRKFPA